MEKNALNVICNTPLYVILRQELMWILKLQTLISFNDFYINLNIKLILHSVFGLRAATTCPARHILYVQPELH